MIYGYSYETFFTILLAILGLIIVIGAQLKVNNSYKKYKNITNKKELTGLDVARIILDKNGLENIYIVETKGELTDHYDPKHNVIRLSKDIFHGLSIAALSIAAHEVGHAIQDKEGYSMMKIRSMLVPVVNLITNIGYFVILISALMGALEYFTIGIFIIFTTIIFQLITLPVEYNASNKARQELIKYKLITKDEEEKVSNMLGAAALTYVASLIVSLLQLLRLFIMSRNRD